MTDKTIVQRTTKSRAVVTRRKVLGAIGAGMFGVAARAFVPATTKAADYPCYGPASCPDCSGASCPSCDRPAYTCSQGDGHCWEVQGGSAGPGCWYYYSCCDWYDGGNLCVCTGYLGIVCEQRS